MNPYLKKFLIANVDLVFEGLYELAALSETKFDDVAIEILEQPVKEYIYSLDYLEDSE